VFQVVTEFNTLDNEKIRELARHMADIYTADLEYRDFPEEMVQFADYAKSRECISPSDAARLINNEELSCTSPKMSIAFRTFMCLMVSNCSGERSFSQMVLVKNKLRSTTTDEHLPALELLSVESDLLDEIPFADIIDKFASAKSRKWL